MYLIIYYDPGCNSIEVEELESISSLHDKTALKRVRWLKDNGAECTRLVKINTSVSISNVYRNGPLLGRR